MSSLGIAVIVFVCVFGAAMFDLFIGNAWPEHHLSQDTKDVVKLGVSDFDIRISCFAVGFRVLPLVQRADFREFTANLPDLLS